MSTPSKAVFLCLEYATSFEVLIFFLDTEVHVTVNHVLKLIATGHLTGLVDLVDDKPDGPGLLAEVGDLLEASNGRT